MHNDDQYPLDPPSTTTPVSLIPPVSIVRELPETGADIHLLLVSIILIICGLVLVIASLARRKSGELTFPNSQTTITR